MKKKIISLLLVLFMFITINNVYADEKEEVIDYAATVTEEMSDDEYWSDKLGDETDKILLDYDDIAIVNNNIVIGDGTGVNDITLITEKKTQAERKNQLVDSANADFKRSDNSACFFVNSISFPSFTTNLIVDSSIEMIIYMKFY